MHNVRYTPIDRDKREIRLLKILYPSARNVQGCTKSAVRISCRLITTSLDVYQYNPATSSKNTNGTSQPSSRTSSRTPHRRSNTEQYYALSYVWGSSDKICDIVVDGRRAKITKSLYSALRAIIRNTSYRLIWADGLCINQDDDDEKSWQVRQMGEVFSRAKIVISYLGSESSREGKTLQSIQELQRALDLEHWSFIRWWAGLVNSDDAPEYSRWNNNVRSVLDTIRSDTCAVADVLHLSKNVYWSRVWIFAELARGTGRVFLTEDFIAENILLALCVVLWELLHTRELREADHMGALTVVEIVPLIHFYGSTFREQHSTAKTSAEIFVALLYGTINLKSSDPKDRMFALLPLLTTSDELGIQIDYSQDLEIVLRQSAYGMIRQGKTSILLFADIECVPQLPSWVPDWTQYDHYIRGLNADALQSQQSATLELNNSFESDPILDAYLIDTIVMTHHSCPSSVDLQVNDALVTEAAFVQWHKSLTDTVWKDDGTHSDPAEILFGPIHQTSNSECIPCLLCSNECVTVTASEQTGSNIKHFHRLRHKMQLGNQLNDKVHRALSSVEHKHLLVLMETITDLIGPRVTPFRTSSYRGFTYRGKCQGNDVVAIVPGVDTPLVLRKILSPAANGSTNERYQIIGAAYVEGIMHGGYFEGQDRSSKIQQITLC